MKIIEYILRIIASIPVSMIVGWSMNFLAMSTIAVAIIFVPMIFFDLEAIPQYVGYNQIIPGLGTILSCFNSNSLLSTILVIILPICFGIIAVIISFIINGLMKITKDNIVAIIMSYIIFILSYIESCSKVFFSDIFERNGIEQGFWDTRKCPWLRPNQTI